MSWKNFRIEELCSKIQSGGTPKTSIPDYYGGTIDWIKTKEVNFCKIYEAETKITELGLSNSSAKLIPENSIIIAMYGNGDTAGRCAMNTIPVATNQACCNLTFNEQIANPFFMYYKISSHYKDFVNLKSGGAQLNLNSQRIKEFEINLPPIETQKRIASILSAYDDLIENNLKRIKLLEETAQNIYKEWFVNFRFPNYEHAEFDVERGLPVGWEIRLADDVYDINIGKTPPRGETQWFSKADGIKWVSIADMNKSSVFISQTNERITKDGVEKFNMRIANEGSVLLSFKLTIGAVVISSEEVVTNEAIAHFNTLEGSILSKEYTYCFLKNFNYKSLGSTSSIGTSINSKIVKNMKIVFPTENVISEFTLSVQGVFKQIQNLTFQNQKLKEARDILLPRLMNRTIDV